MTSAWQWLLIRYGNNSTSTVCLTPTWWSRQPDEDRRGGKAETTSLLPEWPKRMALRSLGQSAVRRMDDC